MKVVFDENFFDEIDHFHPNFDESVPNPLVHSSRLHVHIRERNFTFFGHTRAIYQQHQHSATVHLVDTISFVHASKIVFTHRFMMGNTSTAFTDSRTNQRCNL